ncbi:hypothetical protein FRACYDRAFT_217733 [Fragilariopsis cylindrus CCMP1102]|uniref:Ice-binding protein n=3 Tax=Fragilariopsis cylindrus TaxID=186039 RepID=A0A1E7FJ33_9STRA|nr:hypothetical protein FRACYDRAFT_217733 [Fragilariopsis cylindrus CCMP1102]|eukprot:OEU18181.1 hypothetical protein FRACYDRAFT_217733 [Fragilariopsis cylindrus CCMP1102]
MMNLNLFLISAAAMVSVASASTALPPSPPAVNLGTAEDFVILAKAGVTNVPGGAITGDIGVSPIAASAMTGFDLVMDSSNEFSTSTEITGKAYAPDYMSPTGTKLTTAVSDMLTAYNDAAARPVTGGPFGNSLSGETYTNLGAGEIGGLTLTRGVYTYDINVSITSGKVTFHGGADDVFIIKTSKSVLQAANTEVVLTGGAQAKNIFWSVAQEVNVGAGAHMEGILLVKTAVKFITGSSFVGRVLSATAVTLQSAAITAPATSAPTTRRGLRGLQVA